MPDLQNPDFDPDGKYSLPYQSGMTGIAYNIAETGRELTSMADLFDPAFKGRVGMLTEMRDTVGLTMLLTGKDPATQATMDDADEAFDMIEEANSNGQIRAFTGNDYMDDLATGNFVACIGWSGDISQLALDNPDLRFAIPEEGGMRWFDTMVIPAGAENVANAAVWMNYLYDPENAARIEAYVGYNPPVEGVRRCSRRATRPSRRWPTARCMFPDEATLAQLARLRQPRRGDRGRLRRAVRRDHRRSRSRRRGATEEEDRSQALGGARCPTGCCRPGSSGCCSSSSCRW